MDLDGRRNRTVWMAGSGAGNTLSPDFQLAPAPEDS
jgi:hypothetical protein